VCVRVCVCARGGAGVPWCVELSETLAGALLAASVLAEASSFVLSSTKRTPLLHVTTHPHPHPHPHTHTPTHTRYTHAHADAHARTHTQTQSGVNRPLGVTYKEASRRDLAKLRRPLGVTYSQAKEAYRRDLAKAKATAYVSIRTLGVTGVE
jgi:hypothetical protein